MMALSVVDVVVHILTGSIAYLLIAEVVGSMVFYILSIPIAMKRLHDRDKSGWWLLFFSVCR